MAISNRKVLLAFLIALAGLALTALSLFQRQMLVAGLGGLVTLAFIGSVAALEQKPKN